jgi:peptidoglycan/LPS O-acetylase OafA/YrhL
VTVASASATNSPPIHTSTPSSQRVYRPELDVLRFFAFFCVYLHHTLNTSTSGGFARHFPLVAPWYLVFQQTLGLGLCLFFFLSSYLITSLLRVEQARTGTVNLKKFYVRRILRIWPLYLTFLLAISVAGLWWHPGRLEPLRLVAMLFLAGNWYSVLFGLGPAVISHLWSISVEEQFYLIWPSVSRVLDARKLLLLCCALCLVCLGATWVLGARGATSLSIWLNSIVQSLFFASGALLALTIGIRQQPNSLRRAALASGGGLLLWFAAAGFGGMTDRFHAVIPWRITLGYAVVAIGCALLLWDFLQLPGKFLPRPFLYLGRISYGLYVFHALVLTAAHSFGFRDTTTLRGAGTVLAVKFLIIVAMAALSYELLEKPFLKLKSRFELVPTRAA